MPWMQERSEAERRAIWPCLNVATWRREFCFSKSALLRCLYWVFGVLFDLNCTIFFQNFYHLLELFFNFLINCRVFFSKRMEMLPSFSKMQGKFYKFFQDAGKFLQNFPCRVPEVSKIYQKWSLRACLCMKEFPAISTRAVSYNNLNISF